MLPILNAVVAPYRRSVRNASGPGRRPRSRPGQAGEGEQFNEHHQELEPAGVRTVVEGGMPGWQIAAIAIVAALVAAVAAVLLDRSRSVRRLPVAAA